MFGNSNLKITGLISLGIHLLIIATVSGSFRDADRDRRSPYYPVKVTVVPLTIDEKPKPKMIAEVRVTPPVPLKVGNQTQEKPAGDFTVTKEPISTQPPMSTIVAPEKPKPISEKEEEEGASIEPVYTAKATGSGPGGGLNSGNGEDQGSGELSGRRFYYNPGGATGPGTGPGSGSASSSPGNGDSGNGTGISGNVSYAHASGNGARPRYAHNPKPTYPQEARDRGYEGEVTLRVQVLTTGRVGQIEIKNSSGFELLDRSALIAVKQWRFVPARIGETPIPLWVNIPIKFQLQ